MNKKKYWHNRSRKARKQAYMTEKKQIETHYPKQSDLFYSHDLLHDNIQWADIIFLGKKKSFYNCTIITAQYDLYETIHSNVLCNMCDLMIEHETTIKHPLDHIFKSVERKHVYSINDSIPLFDGLTEKEYIEREIKKAIDNQTTPIYESIKKDHAYYHGIGLNVVINAPALTVDVIDNFINAFRSQNERQVKLLTPLHFPYETIKHLYRYSANKLVDSNGEGI